MDIINEALEFEQQKLKSLSTSDRIEISRKAKSLILALNEIYKRNPDTYYKLVETINLGILKNYQEVQDFWNGYKNPSEIFFKSTYTTYLKANNQAKGMESYSYVVALLVNYLDKKSF